MTDSNQNKPGQLIPFGKYKGQPIEAMAEDTQYCDWLAAQPWFQEKYATYYQVIINNFCEPSETPDHNAIQARFLDDGFRLRFASVVIPRLWWFLEPDGEMIRILIDRASADYAEGIKLTSKANEQSASSISRMMNRGPVQIEFHSGIARPLAEVTTPEFEISGIDCQFKIKTSASYSVDSGGRIIVDNGEFVKFSKGHSFGIKSNFKIEIKPEVGDDYPAILRQMRRNESKYLFTRAYIGEGVNEPTFIQFMDSQGIRVILEHEVDAADPLVIGEFDPDAFFAAVKRKAGC